MSKIKIGYMGGVWDLFHVGHLNCLERAKQMCDYLVVDVTPDEIVFKQKQKYPVIDEKSRMRIVGAVKCVDYVGLSDERRDYGALDNYGFNVLFLSEDHKGKEYYNELEMRMKKNGVEVIYIPYTGGVSTTEIVRKIQENYAEAKD